MSTSFSTGIVRDFNRAAKTYDAYAVLQRMVAEKLFSRYLPQLSESENTGCILDLGCGTGYFHEMLRKNKVYLPLMQIDIAHSMCLAAAGYASPPEYGITYTCRADMHKLPFEDESFQGIFSSMVLQWTDNRQKVFEEVARIIKYGGKFAFSLVGNGSMAELREAFILAGYEPPIHEFVHMDDIMGCLTGAGLTVTGIYSENITMFYDDIYMLSRSIKNVGASYKHRIGEGLKGKGYFAAVEKIYRHKFAAINGLPLTWNIIYVYGNRGSDG